MPHNSKRKNGIQYSLNGTPNNTVSYTCESNGVNYFASSMYVKEGLDDINNGYKNAINNVVALGYLITSVTQTSLNGAIGRAITAVSNNKHYLIHCKIFIKGKRIFQMNTMTSIENANNQDEVYFFNSLQLFVSFPKIQPFKS